MAGTAFPKSGTRFLVTSRFGDSLPCAAAPGSVLAAAAGILCSETSGSGESVSRSICLAAGAHRAAAA